MTGIQRSLFTALGGLLALGLTGCGSSGPRYVKVSGVVTLNNEPYQNAIVKFQPIGARDNPNPGKGSYGITDGQGRYALVVDDKIRGAVVGKHTVRIVTKWDNASDGFDPALGTPDGDPNAKQRVEIDPIPRAWNADSDKTFVVPPEGTTEANFHIVTRQAPEKVTAD